MIVGGILVPLNTDSVADVAAVIYLFLFCCRIKMKRCYL